MLTNTTENSNLSIKNIKDLFEGFADEYEPFYLDWGASVGAEFW